MHIHYCRCHYELKSVLPGFLAAVVPMLLVMIVNPIMYIYAAATSEWNYFSWNYFSYRLQ